jgi:single-strand DNA-binding protein
MNSVILCGRIVRDPDIRVTASAKVARYTLAVDRPSRDQNNNADFISCVAFNNQADFAERYLHKGTKILVDGRIQTGSYPNRDGQKVNTVDVVVNHHEFVEPRTGEPTAPAPVPEKKASSYEQTSMDDFMPIPDDVADDGLPFN